LKDYIMKTPKETGQNSKGYMHTPFKSSNATCAIMWISALLSFLAAMKHLLQLVTLFARRTTDSST
jgi:hypothetical protein